MILCFQVQERAEGESSVDPAARISASPIPCRADCGGKLRRDAQPGFRLWFLRLL
jgi:hypothetical protein